MLKVYSFFSCSDNLTTSPSSECTVDYKSRDWNCHPPIPREPARELVPGNVPPAHPSHSSFLATEYQQTSRHGPWQGTSKGWENGVFRRFFVNPLEELLFDTHPSLSNSRVHALETQTLSIQQWSPIRAGQSELRTSKRAWFTAWRYDKYTFIPGNTEQQNGIAKICFSSLRQIIIAVFCNVRSIWYHLLHDLESSRSHSREFFQLVNYTLSGIRETFSTWRSYFLHGKELSWRDRLSVSSVVTYQLTGPRSQRQF
jgi:hypothetical protein